MITIRFQACDGYRTSRRFKTLGGAQRYAIHMVGATPEIGCGYAVSADGVGTVRVTGTTLQKLFSGSLSPVDD